MLAKGDNNTDSYHLYLSLYPLNVLRSCDYSQLNVLRSCDLTPHCITSPHKCQDPRRQKIPTHPPKSINTSHKYPQDLDIPPRASYNTIIHLRSRLMAVAYTQAQKQRYRITLDLSVFGDFDPHQIDWEKLFKLEPAEKCDAYVEDLSTPDNW